MTATLHPDALRALLRTYHDGLRCLARDLEHTIGQQAQQQETPLDDLVPLSEVRLEVHAAIAHVERAMRQAGMDKEP